MNQLDELNEFLKSKDLELPFNRRHVDKHGANLVWLRKHLTQRNTVPERIETLIQQDIGSLVSK